MKLSLAIAALVIVILAIFIPVYGIVLTALALILATVSALMGERAITIATTVVAFVSVIFLSPVIWVAVHAAESSSVRYVAYVLALAFLFAPIVGMIIDSKKSQKATG